MPEPVAAGGDDDVVSFRDDAHVHAGVALRREAEVAAVWQMRSVPGLWIGARFTQECDATKGQNLILSDDDKVKLFPMQTSPHFGHGIAQILAVDRFEASPPVSAANSALRCFNRMVISC